MCRKRAPVPRRIGSWRRQEGLFRVIPGVTVTPTSYFLRRFNFWWDSLREPFGCKRNMPLAIGQGVPGSHVFLSLREKPKHAYESPNRVPLGRRSNLGADAPRLAFASARKDPRAGNTGSIPGGPWAEPGPNDLRLYAAASRQGRRTSARCE